MSDPTIAIIGTGQLGCSFASALKTNGFSGTIIGYDHDAEHAKTALQRGCIDHAAPSLETAVSDADIILITPPLPYTKAVMEEISKYARADAILTDVGSAKGHVMQCYDALSLSQPLVPGHPIAGTEKSGPMAVNPTLFLNRPFWITPHHSAPEGSEAYLAVKHLWEKAGMVVGTMDAQEHDEIFATCSHLAQLLSWSYTSLLGDYGTDSYKLPGCFYQHVRLGGSDVAMWTGVYSCNQTAVLSAIDQWLADSAELMEMNPTELKDRLRHISKWRHDAHALVPETEWLDDENQSPYTSLLPILLADSYVATILKAEQKLGKSLTPHLGSGMMGVTLPALHPAEESYALITKHENWRDMLQLLRERVEMFREIIAENNIDLLNSMLCEAKTAHGQNLTRYKLL